MTSTPRISLITVCYNAEASIARALQSARAQTYRNFELLVVDGASKDRTLEVVREFGDLPLVVSSEPDQGIYDAMNKGVSRARGDILFFLNADDRLWDPDVLARVAQVFDADPELDMVWGDVISVFPDGDTERDSYAHVTPGTLVYGSLCHQATFARKRLFDRYGVFNTAYPICADYDWFMRVLRGGARYRHVDLDVAAFTRGGAHESSRDTTYWEKARVRRAYLKPLPYVVGEAALYLRTRKALLASRVKRVLCRTIPPLGRHPRCQRLLRRTASDTAGKK